MCGREVEGERGRYVGRVLMEELSTGGLHGEPESHLCGLQGPGGATSEGWRSWGRGVLAGLLRGQEEQCVYVVTQRERCADEGPI